MPFYNLFVFFSSFLCPISSNKNDIKEVIQKTLKFGVFVTKQINFILLPLFFRVKRKTLVWLNFFKPKNKRYFDTNKKKFLFGWTLSYIGGKKFVWEKWSSILLRRLKSAWIHSFSWFYSKFFPNFLLRQKKRFSIISIGFCSLSIFFVWFLGKPKKAHFGERNRKPTNEPWFGFSFPSMFLHETLLRKWFSHFCLFFDFFVWD